MSRETRQCYAALRQRHVWHRFHSGWRRTGRAQGQLLRPCFFHIVRSWRTPTLEILPHRLGHRGRSPGSQAHAMLPIFRRKKVKFCRSYLNRVWKRPSDKAERPSHVRTEVSFNSGEVRMKRKLWIPAFLAVGLALAMLIPCFVRAGEAVSGSGYKVLPAIKHGNLTVFPVVAAKSHDTQGFLTLDEGLRSGEVVVTESGIARPMIRRRHPIPISPGGAQVNQLVLINNSQRPLLLLAGEIVTGGKQDRVIGKDRIVPPESDTIDLSVFCVEPGRWTGASMNFKSLDAAMAQPAVRAKAMGAKNQQQVWDEVGKSKDAMAMIVPAPAAEPVRSTTSYARVMSNDEVKKQVDSVAEPIQHNYQSLIRQLRDQNAVGVVVAVNGQIVWADIFARKNLMENDWPNLVRDL